MSPLPFARSALASCAVVFTAALATPLAAQAAPLIGLYTFEDAGGNFANVVDSSGQGKHPNFFEARTVTVTTGGQGYQGEAAKFTPTSPWYYNTGSITSGGGFTVPIDIKPSAGDLTIGGWLKLNTTSATAGNPKYTFFSHDDGCWDRGMWLDRQVGGGAWQTTGGTGCTGPQNTGATMTQDAWHLVVVSMSGINASLYINGAFQSTTVANDYGTSAPDLRFGAFDRSGGTEPWEGLMDNLFVFRSALTAGEVGTIHSQGLNGILQVAGLAQRGATEVPEPGSLALAGLALCALAGLRRRRG